MLFPIPRMPFALLLVHHLPDSQEEDQAPPSSRPCLVRWSWSPLRPLSNASLIIPAGFCCYSVSWRRPLLSPNQMLRSQVTVLLLGLPSRALLKGSYLPFALDPTTQLPAQLPAPLPEFPLPDVQGHLAAGANAQHPGESPSSLALACWAKMKHFPAPTLAMNPWLQPSSSERPTCPVEPPGHRQGVPPCFFSVRALNLLLPRAVSSPGASA